MASFSQFCWKRLWLSPMWSWNVFPSSVIWVTHLVQEEVWRRQQEPEWDEQKICLGKVQGVISYPDSSRCIIPHKGKYTRLVSRVHWHMGLKPGRWRKQICIVWRGRNGWQWDGCAGCRSRIGHTVWNCTVFWVYRSWPRWWGRVDWGGLDMWNVKVGLIGCRPVEMWWWRGWDVRVKGGRLGMSVWRMIRRCLVYILNGQCSGICGEASYQEERLTLAQV